MVYSMVDNLNDGNAEDSPNKKHKYSGWAVYLFAEPHLRPRELVEAASKADLTQRFRVA